MVARYMHLDCGHRGFEHRTGSGLCEGCARLPPPNCCPDAAGGEMVAMGGGVYLCVWCGRERDLERDFDALIATAREHAALKRNTPAAFAALLERERVKAWAPPAAPSSGARPNGPPPPTAIHGPGRKVWR